ncbi:hypothetical protein MauCBS54593_004517 [Microsporum audouinii]
MDLASAVGPPAGLDAALMFGFGGTERRPREAPIAPSPLFQTSECSIPVSLESDSNSTLPVFSIPEPKPPPPPQKPKHKRANNIPDALGCLLRDKGPSLNEIRRALRDIDINLRVQPKLSRIIFENILKTQPISRRTVADIHTFLLDPSLNAPGSNNYTALMEYLTIEKFPLSIVIQHLDQLRVGFSLGTIPLDEVESIINNLRHINGPGGILALSNPEFLATVYTELWLGLLECSVLRVSDLGASTLKLWLDIVVSLPAGTETVALCNHIIHTVRKMGLLDRHMISRVILYILKYTAEDQGLPREDGWAKRKILRYRLQDISNTLRYSPGTVAISSIFDTTESLIYSPRYDTNRSQLLLIWSWMLQRLLGVRGLLSSEAWMGFPTSPSSSPSLDQPNKRLSSEGVCFVRMWLLWTIGRRTKEYFEIDSQRMDLFEKYLALMKKFSGLQEKGRLLAKFDALMAFFEELGLPYTNHVLVAAVRSKYMKLMGITGPLPQAMITTINSLDSGALHKPELIWAYEKGISVKGLGNALFEQAALETDITDPHFVHRLLLYTENDWIHHRGLLLRLLENHIPLRYALQKLRRSPPGKGVVKATQHLPGGVPILDPQACLNTITFLALAFAVIPASDRVAWRLTYRCCKLLRTQNAPILPAMCRALYHAGIQRYVNSGSKVPYERRKYIMDIVEEVQGPQAASRLGT